MPEDPYLGHDLERYFPDPLPERYRGQMRSHRLRREIIATVVANQLVDRAGTTFAFRLAEETGAARAASRPRLRRGARGVRDASALGRHEALDNRVDAATQLAMLIEGRRLVERATRWLVRAHPRALDIDATTERFAPGARRLAAALPEVLRAWTARRFVERRSTSSRGGRARPLARRVAGHAGAAVGVRHRRGRDRHRLRPGRWSRDVYFRLGAELGLDWLRDRILELPRADRWQALARAALRDDLYRLHRALTREALLTAGASRTATGGDRGAGRNATRPDGSRASVLADVKASGSYDTTTLPVALRELGNLVQPASPRRRPDRPPASRAASVDGGDPAVDRREPGSASQRSRSDPAEGRLTVVLT